MESPPGHTCARLSDKPGSWISDALLNSSTLSISASMLAGDRSLVSAIPSSAATDAVDRIVPEVPIASIPVDARKCAFTGRSLNLAATLARSKFSLLIAPPGKYSSVSTTQPIFRLSIACGLLP